MHERGHVVSTVDVLLRRKGPGYVIQTEGWVQQEIPRRASAESADLRALLPLESSISEQRPYAVKNEIEVRWIIHASSRLP